MPIWRDIARAELASALQEQRPSGLRIRPVDRLALVQTSTPARCDTSEMGGARARDSGGVPASPACRSERNVPAHVRSGPAVKARDRESRAGRSEEHTSELQSLRHLVCRLLLEKK